MMEYWNIGIMGGMSFGLPIIPPFHYSNIPTFPIPWRPRS